MIRQTWLFSLSLGILSWLAALAPAQESPEIFSIRSVNLEIRRNPWGDDLDFSVRGAAEREFDSGIVTVSLFYEGILVETFDFPIRAAWEQGKIGIDERWPALNKGGQEILPGEYAARVQVLRSKQPANVLEAWSAKFGEKEEGVDVYRKFPIRPEDVGKVAEALRNFHIARIRRLNELFRELQEKRKEAMLISRDLARGRPNAFEEGRTFSERKWRVWFKNQFETPLVREKEILRKHWKKVYHPRYPLTLGNMQQYAALLERIGSIFSVELCRKYNVRYDADTYYLDPDSLQSVRHLAKLIERLHGYCALELGIRLQDALGYLPPPRIE